MPRRRPDLSKPLQQFIRRWLYRRKPRRLHLSSTDKLRLKNFEEIEQKVERKPNGIWYGFNESWMEWCVSEYAGKIQPYIYEIIVDEEQILRISTDEEFERFEDNHHGIPEYMKHLREIDPVLALFPTMPFVNGYGYRLGADHIDYPKVAEKYGGIEITPLLHRKRLSASWYYGWDCASGCVWSRTAIQDIRLFARYDRHLQEYVRVKDSVYNRRKR